MLQIRSNVGLYMYKTVYLHSLSFPLLIWSIFAHNTEDTITKSLGRMNTISSILLPFISTLARVTQFCTHRCSLSKNSNSMSKYGQIVTTSAIDSNWHTRACRFKIGWEIASVDYRTLIFNNTIFSSFDPRDRIRPWYNVIQPWNYLLLNLGSSPFLSV